jgi:hypothetical protein
MLCSQRRCSGSSSSPLARAGARRRCWSGSVGAQPDYPIDLVASITSDDDHRDIAARRDLAQQVEAVFLAEPQIEDDKIELASG